MDTIRLDTSRLEQAPIGPAGAAAAFVLGQHLEGQVLAALSDGTLLLAFGERQVVAETRTPLEPGQQIAVEVVRTWSTIELRLERQAFPGVASEENYGLAAVLQAISSRDPSAPAAGDPGAWLRALAALPAGQAAGGEGKAAGLVATLFAPLVAAADRDTLAAGLRRWIEDGGALFEAHLRQELAVRGAGAPEDVLAALRPDVKVLAGQLARAAEAEGQRETSQATSPQPQAEIGQRLLDRQVDFAYRWLADGVAAFEVPVRMPGGDACVRVLIRRDPEAGAGGRAARRTRISVIVPSDVLGPVEADLSWQGAALEGTFYVDRQPTRSVLERDIGDLAVRLRSVFTRVSFDVQVDAERLHARTMAIRPGGLPGGSIVNVRV